MQTKPKDDTVKLSIKQRMYERKVTKKQRSKLNINLCINKKQEKEKKKQFKAKVKELNKFKSEPKIPFRVELVSSKEKSIKQIPVVQPKIPAV